VREEELAEFKDKYDRQSLEKEAIEKELTAAKSLLA
jgi:hypothetical protein